MYLPRHLEHLLAQRGLPLPSLGPCVPHTLKTQHLRWSGKEEVTVFCVQLSSDHSMAVPNMRSYSDIQVHTLNPYFVNACNHTICEHEGSMGRVDRKQWLYRQNQVHSSFVMHSLSGEFHTVYVHEVPISHSKISASHSCRVRVRVQIAFRMHHHAHRSFKLLQISKENLTDVQYRAN